MKQRQVRYSANPCLSFPHIFVYEASAGSGKTRRLAQRYVDFLLHYSGLTAIPFNFRNLLAITFTNEAVDQMKQEILKMLKAKALGRDKDSAAAMQVVDEIIANFSDFAVRTIDSFVNSLMVASSLELRLPADYEIMPQPRPYLEYVLDRFLDEIIYDQDVASLFWGFLNHFLLIEGQKRWSPKKILFDLMNKFYREENSRAKLFQELPGDVDLSQLEENLKIKIRQFLSSLSSAVQPNQRFIKGLESSLDNAGSHFLKSISRYVNKGLSPGEGILNKNAGEPDLGLTQGWRDITSQYHNYARAFVWLRYNFYFKVFNKFRQRLESFKQEKRIVFLDELNRKVRQFLISQGFVPAEIYYKLSSVFYHYLIDEFQDTNLLQWENIQALVEDALSKGGSLFYVGDKKQAIYRFRGGEVELFDLIKRRFARQVDKVYEQVLPCNYRSGEAIVEFNNSLFSQESLGNFLSSFNQLSDESREKILAVFRGSQQKPAGRSSAGSGYVRIELQQGGNKQELEQALNIRLKEAIFQLSSRFRYQDILILVRDNQQVERVADFLLEQGLPVCASRTISIRRNYLIRQIIALLKFLNSPVDNLSFANFILGEVFSSASGLSQQRLRSWLEGLSIGEESIILYTRFRLEFPGIWQEFLQYLFNAVGFLPVYDLTESILAKFNIEENFPHLCGFTRRLLELLNNLQEEGKNSLVDFLEWFEAAQEEDLFVQLPSGLDAIRILTIHKAKGLSSAAVILPFAALEIKVGDASKIVHEKPEGLYLLYLKKEICQNHPELAAIYQREYSRALLDELNCLYVALTRASSELYIFLPEKINRSDNPLIPLLFNQKQDKADGAVREFGSKLNYAPGVRPVTDKPQPAAKPGRASTQEMFKNMLREQLIPLEQIVSSEKRNLIKRGEVLHYLLAVIDPLAFVKDPSLYSREIKDACRLLNYTDCEEVTQCLSDFLRNPKMQQFFNPAFTAFNEKEIVDRQGNLRRIDRLVLAKDKVLIIDYKTGEEYQAEHQRQLKEYAELISGLYPDTAVEGWLVYIDKNQILQGQFLRCSENGSGVNRKSVPAA